MLTYEQIVTLTDKGFSPDQIVKLTGEEIPEPEKEPEKLPETEPETEPEKKPETEPEKQPEMEPDKNSPLSVLQEAIKGFSAEVAEMKKALQASNIRTIIRDDVPPEKSADDVLAELIHPTINKEVK